jgi:UDP-glucose 4-epimerase
LVTGAAGFIGSHLAERLLAEGYDVVGLDAFTDFYDRAIKEANLKTLRASPRFTFVEANLCTADLKTILARDAVRFIFHEAGQPGVRPSWGAQFAAYVENNITATQHLLEAVKDAPIEKLIFASSSSVYGNAEKLPTDEATLPQPVSPYGVTKLAAEHLCMLYGKNFGAPCVALRYFSVYGPRQRPDGVFYRFIRALLRDEPIPLLGDGEQTRDFTYVDDIVEANIGALHASGNILGQIYNIGGGSRITIRAAIRKIEGLVGKPARLDQKPAAPGDHRHGAADISKARRDLGYAPRVGLDEGLKRQIEWQMSLAAR